jgi:dienelactone hydrolase
MSNRNRSLAVLVAVLAASSWLETAGVAQPPPPPQVVDIVAADGVKLKATYFSAGKPGPGVLLLHQCNRQRKVWDDLAERLAASGLNVLTFDFRGFGESGGTPIDKLAPEEVPEVFQQKFPADVDTAFQYLVSQPGVTRGTIGAGGASCGVNQSVQLARRHAEVKGLVLLSEGTDAAGRQFLRESPGLPLFLAVADDDPDPGVVEIMQWLMSLAPHQANRFERYSTGGHGVEMFAAHKELPGEIVDWFRATLGTPPVTPPGKPTPRSSARTQFLELVDRPGGIAKAVEQYAEARKRNPKVVLFSEEVINRVGYEHLLAGNAKDAAEILKLNVLAFPSSPNVYDSLSDAYLADGQKDLARQNAKKALEVLASDTADPPDRRKAIQESAKQKLKQLGDAPD